MIEIFLQAGRDALPPAGRVAGRTTLIEAVLVRIAMAVVAFAERNPRITRLSVRRRRVALLAFHLFVQACKRIARLRVIKRGRDILPVVEVVALCTVRPQSSLMRVVVAAPASLGQPDEGSRQILHLDQRFLAGCDVFWHVALPAFEARVLPLQGIAGLLVIERLRIPLDDREVAPVVIGVAFGALLARTRPQPVRRVQPLVSIQPSGDLRVTVQAFESRLSTSQLVTRGAIGSALKIFVRTS